MSDSFEDQFEILHGRLLAQNRILMTLFGYILVADTSAARGIVSALSGLPDKADEFVDSEPGQQGFQVELLQFIIDARKTLG